MQVEHSLTAVGRCPVDGCWDVYEVTVRTSRVIRVEDILAAVKSLTAGPLLQEEFTRDLATTIGAEVVTVGCHSGVRTRVVCGQTGTTDHGASGGNWASSCAASTASSQDG